MKFASWNVNGYRAILSKNFKKVFDQLDVDVFGLQEIKCQEGQVDVEYPGYYQTYSYAQKPGYAGTGIISREKPLQVVRKIGLEVSDEEGRICAAEFEKFWFVSVYSPNSQDKLQRLPIREEWDAHLRQTVEKFATEKPVILCGDFNVAHEPIDLAKPESDKGSAGFTDAERNDFTQLLDSGFTDTWRYLHPNTAHKYTWWSYRERGRSRNIGWRLDYFLISNDLRSKLENSQILDDIMGSDHCPITLELAHL